MSVAHIAWAMEQKTGSPTRKAVLIVLAECANSHSGKCCPRIAKIAERTELSEATVKRSLNDLESAGFLTRTRDRRPDGTLGVYHYDLPVLRVEAVDQGASVTPDPEITVIPQEPGKPLEPTSPPAVPPSAQAIVAAYVDGVRARGAPTPGRVVGMVARGVKELLDEGVSDEVVLAAVDLMVERRLHPATLATLVLEAAAGPRERASPTRYGRGMTTAQILEMTRGDTRDG